MRPAPAPSLAGLYGSAQKRPLYSRAPRLYFRTPAWLKSIARRAFAVQQGQRTMLVERYLARLDDLPSGDGHPVPLLLTHDVDTEAGYANLPRLLATEESLGMASLSLMVTHRYSWAVLDLATLSTRGHAFGVHDTTHDNRLAYLSPDRIVERIRAAQQALGGLDCGAFRAPAFLRSEDLYRGLARCVALDLSTIDWALLWPHPGDGIGTPFPLRHRGVLCVPTTLPRDGELIALGLDGNAMVDVWKKKASVLARVGAPVVLLTHPDPSFMDSPERIAAYGDLLCWFKESGMFRTLPPAECMSELKRAPALELPAVDE